MENNNENSIFINANESPVENETATNQDIEPFSTETAEPFPVEQVLETISGEGAIPDQEVAETTDSKAEKTKNPNKHLTNLKRAVIAIIGLVAIRGGTEIAKDVEEAKKFIEESGYTASEFFESAYKDILFVDKETNTITVDSPATIKELAESQFPNISNKNQAEVKEYVVDLNQNNPQVYTNNQGEIGPGSQIKVPASIEERSPLQALMDYAFAPLENEREIEQSPNIKPNPDKAPKAEAENNEETEPMTYAVQPGDSLWGIADGMLKESGAKYDPTDVMGLITYLKEMNGLKDDGITAGANIEIPSKEDVFKLLEEFNS